MDEKIFLKIKNAPKAPGVYIFYKNQIPLYIGKASNLKSRLQNYLKITDVKTQQLHEEADHLKIIKLTSSIEALIEEARLIKELKPQLNVYWRDDKNHFYVAFTNEKFSKIFITHQPNLKAKSCQLKTVLGPFTDGQALRLILKILRRHFPYCTCFARRLVRRNFSEGGSLGEGGFHLRHCLNAQINNCLGYCCQLNYLRDREDSLVAGKIYRKNINEIKNILSGKNKNILKKIVRPEDNWAAENILEHSQFLEREDDGAGRQLSEGSSRRHQKHGLFASAKSFDAERAGGLAPLLQAGIGAVRRWAQEPPVPEDNWRPASQFKKIECYDISNFAGKEAVGAFTVLVNKNGQWQSDQSQFRKFKIKYTKNTRNDPAMISEILQRRLNHPEWPYPDLIIIDGGIAQYKSAKNIFDDFLKTKNYKLKTDLISFAKPTKTINGSLNGSTNLPLIIIEKAVHQTHRYVIGYHRQLRDKI